MTAPSIAQVRDTIAKAVAKTGLRCDGYLLDTKNVPCAQVWREDFDPRLVFDATKAMYEFRIMVFAGRAEAQTSMAFLDRCAEPTGEQSIRAAIVDETNWTTMGLDYVNVTSIGGEKLTEPIAGVQYLTIQFDVEVVW